MEIPLSSSTSQCSETPLAMIRTAWGEGGGGGWGVGGGGWGWGGYTNMKSIADNLNDMLDIRYLSVQQKQHTAKITF